MRFLDDFNTISSRRYFSDNYLREIKREEEREERRNIDFLVSEKFRIEKEISKHSKNSDVQSKVAVINFNKALKKIKNEIERRFSEEEFTKAVRKYWKKRYNEIRNGGNNIPSGSNEGR